MEHSTYFTKDRSSQFFLIVFVAAFYLISHLFFYLSLDDSVNFINAKLTLGNGEFKSLHQFIFNQFTPPPSDSMYLYRPLRVVYTFALYSLLLKWPYLPTIINALTAGLAALVLYKTGRNSNLTNIQTTAAVIWFFGCIPVVAMGNVVLVSQFIVISGIYLIPLLFHLFVQSGSKKYLLACFLSSYVFGLYAEATLIAAIAVGIYGLLLLLVQMRVKAASLAILSSLIICLLIIGNCFLVTGDPHQISRTVSGVLLLRGYSVDNLAHQGLMSLFYNRFINYLASYRMEMLTGLFFSISPLLIGFTSLSFLLYEIFNKRIYPYFFLTAFIGFYYGGYINAQLLTIFLFFIFGKLKELPLLISILAAGFLILGPTFVIDTHVTYILPALLLLIFKINFDIFFQLNNRFLKSIYIIIGLWCSLILINNYYTGAYFSQISANDNRQIAKEFSAQLDEGAIATNFRHIFDLYLYTNLDRSASQYKEKAYFTATVPLYGEERKLHSENEFISWEKKMFHHRTPTYLLVVEHQRLPGKVNFHSSKFISVKGSKAELIGEHHFKASAFNLDPGFWFADYFYNHQAAAGFVGYPIFPDMIDDIGIEYHGLHKMLIANYRLFRVQPEEKMRRI